MKRTPVVNPLDHPLKEEVAGTEAWPKALREAWQIIAEIDGDSDLTSALQHLVIVRLAEAGHVAFAKAAAQSVSGSRQFMAFAAAAESAVRKGELEKGKELARLSMEGLKVVGLGHSDRLRIRLISVLVAAELDEDAETLLAGLTDPEWRGLAVAAWLKWQDPNGGREQVRKRLAELESSGEPTTATTLFNQAGGLLEVLAFWRTRDLGLDVDTVTHLCRRAIALAEDSHFDMSEILLNAVDLVLKVGAVEQASRMAEPYRAAVPQMEWGVERTAANLLRFSQIERALGREEDAKAAETRALDILKKMGDDLTCEAHLLAGKVMWENGRTEQAQAAWCAMLKAAEANPNPNVKRQMLAKMLIEMNRLGPQSDIMWGEIAKLAMDVEDTQRKDID